MKIDEAKRQLALKYLFSLVCITLAILHIFGKPKLDTISISLLLLSVLPALLPYIHKKLLPYLKQNFKSIELFGMKAELLAKIEKQEEKLERQEVELRNQQDIINKLVVYSMAFYLDAMLRDFKKCEDGEMKEYLFRKNITFEHNLRYLRDNGHIEMTFQIGALKDGENIASKIKLTPIGRFYIDLRRKFETAKILEMKLS